MTTNATPAVSKRRPSQFYIEVPPSPVALSEYKPLSSYSINRSHRAYANLKENMLALPHKNDTPPLHTSLKRKSSLNAEVPPVKKIKQQQRKPTFTKDEDNLSGTDTDGHPNGYIYCHQCLKKRDIMASVQCTAIIRPSRKSDAKGIRCTAKFCKTCLMNRYGEDITQIKDGICHGMKAVGHADDSGYVFKCPKCRDICNCARCRKLKGLEPTGNLTNIARKAGASSAVHILRENPNIEGTIPGKGNQVKTKSATKDKGSNLHSKCRNTSKHSSMTKILAPIWKRLHMPLDLCAMEDRIYIREFMLRFGKVMVPAISRNHLRELELFGGSLRGRDDLEDMPSWVGESCVKSMILGLLGFLVTECHNTEAIKSSMKDIRATGGNLNKLWNALQTLRVAPEQTVYHKRRFMTFPDPLPPPASATVHQTRSMRSANSGQRSVNIICSGQMVPVVAALINFALTTNSIREEIEAGLKEAKEVSQKSKEAIKLENERWTNSRKVLETKTLEKERNHAPGQYKLLRGMHKRHLLNIDNSLEVISSNYVGRFQGLLGKDHEGRTYWTTSPGIEEIVAAHEFLTTISSERSSEDSGSSKKKKKGQLGPEARPRDNSKEWTWFVAVWGRAPPDWEASDSEDDGEDTREKWWVFDEVGEIRKLANWLDDGNQDSGEKGERDTLSKRLIDFADLLEWRGRVDRARPWKGRKRRRLLGS